MTKNLATKMHRCDDAVDDKCEKLYSLRVVAVFHCQILNNLKEIGVYVEDGRPTESFFDRSPLPPSCMVTLPLKDNLKLHIRAMCNEFYPETFNAKAFCVEFTILKLDEEIEKYTLSLRENYKDSAMLDEVWEIIVGWIEKYGLQETMQ